MSDLTIIICAYKATKELTLCLHQLAQFGVTKDELLIYENSPSYYSENRNLLNKYGIKYIDNPGGGHADTVKSILPGNKIVYGYPRGQERVNINKAFDEFFASLRSDYFNLK